MLKNIKIAAGAAIAILIATLVGLQSATTAGIITLLTIQNTKKETIGISFKRFLGFVLATLLSYACFILFGYHVLSYGLFLFLFVSLCIILKLQDAITMNAVLVTHYLVYAQLNVEICMNEFLLLLIGVTVGILLNLYMPNEYLKIRNIQTVIEFQLKTILKNIALGLTNTSIVIDKSSFDLIDQNIKDGMKYASSHINNSLLKEENYFISYMYLRKQQVVILKKISSYIVGLTELPNQASELSNYINVIADNLSESNNAKQLIIELECLIVEYKSQPLPLTRNEFEARAILYMIVIELQNFLTLKAQFVDTLSIEQINHFFPKH